MQLVILSGKGGTGKTSMTAAFAHLAHERGIQAVLADGDVDAANMELVLQPRRLEEYEFVGGSKAMIDEELCQGCGICERVCRFEAICPHPPAYSPDPSTGLQTSSKRRGLMEEIFYIDPFACEGCAACVFQCPEKAIHLQPQLAGHWFRSESQYGPLFHAELRPAQENSGKLVTMVKQQARLLSLDTGAQLVIVDGPPGIGCPVISAVSGADLALIVAESTAAGIHDMERVLQLTRHFRVPALVCINKADIYPDGEKQIKAYCKQNHLELVGSVPFDERVTEAMVRGEPVTAFRPDAPASRSLVGIWNRVTQHLNGKEGSP